VLASPEDLEPFSTWKVSEHQSDLCGVRRYKRGRRLGDTYSTPNLDLSVEFEAQAENWRIAHLRHRWLVSYCRPPIRNKPAKISSAFITSVMRLVESIRSLNDPNISISLLPVSLWAAAEVSAGLVVCCLPLFPRLFSNNNARAILHSSEPSQEFTGLSSKITAGAHVTEYDDSSETSIQSQRNNFVVMKSVTLDQTSTYV
jgi:hypothetical protein